MEMKEFVLGPLENNAFVLYDKKPDCVVIDPPLESGDIVRFLQEEEMNPVAILLTHGHFDHIGGLDDIRKFWAAPVYIHEEEKKYLLDHQLNGSAFYGFPGNTTDADKTFSDADELKLAGLRFKVLHTPGHTPGGSCFLVEDTLISGDTLFYGSVGRTDLPEGSFRKLIDSIHRKLIVLPDTTPVYPGHGPSTTIGNEKNMNPYIKLNGKK